MSNKASHDLIQLEDALDAVRVRASLALLVTESIGKFDRYLDRILDMYLGTYIQRRQQTCTLYAM